MAPRLAVVAVAASYAVATPTAVAEPTAREPLLVLQVVSYQH